METTGTGTETETMRDVVVNYFFFCLFRILIASVFEVFTLCSGAL